VIYTQTAIVAAIEVAKEVGSLDRIATIDIATSRTGYERAGSEPEEWDPKTRETADVSSQALIMRIRAGSAAIAGRQNSEKRFNTRLQLGATSTRWGYRIAIGPHP
jgi:hypothetical protein